MTRCKRSVLKYRSREKGVTERFDVPVARLLSSYNCSFNSYQYDNHKACSPVCADTLQSTCVPSHRLLSGTGMGSQGVETNVKTDGL